MNNQNQEEINQEEMIVKKVKVNRSLTTKQAIDATGRVQYVNDQVVAEMPRGEGEEVEVYFFKLGREINCADLEKEYEIRDLKPDPMAQAKVNQDDPTFADTHLNGCQWKDKAGKKCCAYFERWSDESSVDVDQGDDVWGDFWWFGGVRK